MTDCGQDIVHVATAPNETIAMMWRDVLSDEGIVAVIKGGGSGYGLGHNLLNEQYILVRRDQAIQAAEILHELESDEADLDAWDVSGR